MSEVIKIKAWSHSRLSVFEECPKRAKLAYIDRIKEPDRGPPPKGKKEWANDRGTRIHDAAEHFVRGTRPDVIAELAAFSNELRRARELFQQGIVEGEQMWCFNDAWEPIPDSDYKNTWCRIKVDLLVNLTPEYAVLIDYKTGRRYGNEVKHAEQCQLYQVGAFLRAPKLQKITTELWYTDQDEMATMTFTRNQGMLFLKNFNNRGMKITQAELFPSNPNAFSCRWCPYSPRSQEGLCEEGL